MKVLTIVATIFIPLSFIAGVYGMNFEYMPELGQRWAYPSLLALMAIIGVGLTAVFWRRGWIGPLARASM
jgi:magnesium transporter